MSYLKAKRKALLMGITRRGGGIPDGYKQVQYIGTTQNAGQTAGNGIVTGVVPTRNTRVVCTMKMTLNTSVENLCGVSSVTNGRFAWGFSRSVTATNFYVGIADKNIATTVPIDGTIHEWEVRGDGYWRIDEISGQATVASMPSMSQSFGLFARMTASSPALQKTVKGRIYGCKVYEGVTLIRNFVPCYRVSDGQNGLWDLCGSISAKTGTSFYVDEVSPTFLNERGLTVNNYHELLRWYAESYGGVDDVDILEGGTVVNDTDLYCYQYSRNDSELGGGKYRKWSIRHFDLTTNQLININTQYGTWDAADDLVPFSHGNDMTYNPTLGKIIVACLAANTVEMDLNTLSVGQQLTGPYSSMEYIPSSNVYITGGSDIWKRSATFSALTRLAANTNVAGFNNQGIYADDNYIYKLVTYEGGDTIESKDYPTNMIRIFDYSGNIINELEFFGANVTYEFEFITRLSDGTFIVGAIGNKYGGFTQILSFEVEGLPTL